MNKRQRSRRKTRSTKQLKRKLTKPEFLYKYTPARAPVVPEEQRQEKQRQLDALLTTPQLWLAAPSTFNDPMDCKPKFRFTGGAPEARERFRRVTICRMVKRDHPHAEGDELRNLIVEYSRTRQDIDANFEMEADLALTGAIQSIGVLCLSERPNDPVMFYHYGDKHAGMCLKFRTDGLLAGVEPVTYSENYPAVEFFDDSNHERQFEKIFLTKYKSWEYEHEWRYVDAHLGEHPQRLRDYPPELLSGVIFGYKMPQEDRDRAVDLLRRRPSRVELFEARLDRNHYQLDIVPYTPAG
ncbi:DUF2971 domain-containing protein [Paraburkholderia mimosarum]|uniref:DUF2971 domain-containing protein n=1 Tax=Paraburkholderia mimosarum TaxID=312026 RepID=UPI000413FE99|nr:DUF2971 domain-containing protein [Paraburkholderia mimosarum]